MPAGADGAPRSPRYLILSRLAISAQPIIGRRRRAPLSYTATRSTRSRTAGASIGDTSPRRWDQGSLDTAAEGLEGLPKTKDDWTDPGTVDLVYGCEYALIQALIWNGRYDDRRVHREAETRSDACCPIGGGISHSCALARSHSQAITGLTPNTSYHFRVKSPDAAGNLSVSSDFRFKTRSR